MAKLQLTKTRFQAGVWEGVLSGASDTPDIEVTHQTHALSGVQLAAVTGQKGDFTLSVPIPSDLLSDGFQTFVISDKHSGEVLNSFAIVAGEALDEDLRAELNLLRAELNLLKGAFRRHCQETA